MLKYCILTTLALYISTLVSVAAQADLVFDVNTATGGVQIRNDSAIDANFSAYAIVARDANTFARVNAFRTEDWSALSNQDFAPSTPPVFWSTPDSVQAITSELSERIVDITSGSPVPAAGVYGTLGGFATRSLGNPFDPSLVTSPVGSSPVLDADSPPLSFAVTPTISVFFDVVVESEFDSSTFTPDVYVDGVLQAAAVPEPSAMLYGGLVSVLAGCVCRIKRRQQKRCIREQV